MEKGGKENTSLEERNVEARKRIIKAVEKDEKFTSLANQLLKEEKPADMRNLADIRELLNYANLKKHLVIPTMGFYVEYCPLRICDRIEIMGITNENKEVETDERNRRTLYLLLNRADPEVWTKKIVNNIPAIFVDAILMEYGQQEADPFLQPIIERKLRGFLRIPTPKD